MLYLHLTPMFEARGIENPSAFLRKSGFSRSAIATLLYTTPRNPKLDHIEALCKVLYCTPNEILLWVKPRNEIIPENHPLYTLRKKEVPNLKKAVAGLSTIPLDQLTELIKTITPGKNEGEKQPG